MLFAARYADLYRGVDLPEPETLLSPPRPREQPRARWPLEILTERMLKGGHGDGKLVLSSDDPLAVRKATYQKFVKDVLRCVAAIDENIGRLLDYLDQQGLARDTVVIYTGDQGYFLGEHDYFDKRFMLEESLRMPFVVRYPREIRPGTVLDDIILNVDFARPSSTTPPRRPPSDAGPQFPRQPGRRTPRRLARRDVLPLLGELGRAAGPLRHPHAGREADLLRRTGRRAGRQAVGVLRPGRRPPRNPQRLRRPQARRTIEKLKKRLTKLQADLGDKP